MYCLEVIPCLVRRRGWRSGVFAKSTCLDPADVAEYADLSSAYGIVNVKYTVLCDRMSTFI